MKLLPLLAVVLLAACASKTETPNSALVVDKEVQPLSRNEVIIAIQECEQAGTRAVMVHSKRKINNFTSDIVVDVTCAPRR